MRQTLICIAVLSALSLPGLASAEIPHIDTDSRVNPPGVTAKGTGPKGIVTDNKGERDIRRTEQGTGPKGIVTHNQVTDGDEVASHEVSTRLHLSRG